MRILLTDGSGLTSRQVAGYLGRTGHHVGVLSPDPLGLTRFTRHVRAWHQVPPYGDDPLAWLDAALAVYETHHYDVLLPTQEQVAVLAAAPHRLAAAAVRTAVPSFAALAAVLDKASASATLERLAIPQPHTVEVRTADQLAALKRFPVYLKAAIGTASSSVHRVDTPAALTSGPVADGVRQLLAGEGCLVAQQAAPGPLAMVQTVFGDGTLLAAHACERIASGVRGGAAHKRSLPTEHVIAPIVRLGQALRWHGALSADVILTADGPLVIDVNPRLVEPVNARRAGVDLAGALVAVACGAPSSQQPAGRADVATHQLLLALLGAASGSRPRRAIAAELWAAARRSGRYASSVEELTPARHDWRAALPLVVATATTLTLPSTWRFFAGTSVRNYALSPAGWSMIRTAVAEGRLA